MGIRALGILLVFLLSGCASTGTEPEAGVTKQRPGAFYRYEMAVKVNGKSGVGTLVVPRADTYEIEVDTRGRLDAFTWSSCSRDGLVREIKGNSRWGWGAKRNHTFTYKPEGVELTDFCSLDLGGYDKTATQHSWAMIDFEDPEYKLGATVSCNGEVVAANGVSLCQGKAGLYQEIEFPEAVEFEVEEKCEKPEAKSDKKLTLRLSLGVCYYLFYDKTGSKVHRLTTYGYEAFLLPEQGT